MVDIPSNHKYYLPENSSSWEFYYILIRPTSILEHWNKLVEQLGPVLNIPLDNLAIIYLKNIFLDAGKNRISDGFLASTIVYQFIMELYRFSNVHKREKQNWPPKIQTAVGYLQRNYANLQSLEDIASSVGLSKYHFTRIFKKTTGYTPIEYLTKIRIERAVYLLRQTDLTIEDIAKAIGYSNGSYFIKVFRQWLGFSPGEFRLGKDLATITQLKFD